MSPRLSFSLVIVALVSAGLACSTGTPGPNSDANLRATGLAQTAAAILTSTAQASITPATVTPSPTLTPVPIPSTATVAPPPAAATATATVPAVPPAGATACPSNDSDFVLDVTIPDGTHFAGGTVFNKTWRLRNSGSCTWNTSFQLRYVSGDALGGATINLTAPVPPGATTDITVSFTAPTATGSHTSRWQLFDDAGTAFGTKPYVQITVP